MAEERLPRNTKNQLLDSDEATEFYAQLGKCISVWAVVEISLLRLFRLCIHDADIYIGGAVYHAVENFRSRLGMINAALAVALKDHDLLKEWAGIPGEKAKPAKRGLFHKITAASQKRNHLAHYTVIFLGMIKKPPSIYMREALTKPSSRSFRPTQPTGGYYVNDLRQIHTQFVELRHSIDEFTSRAGPPIKRHIKSSRQKQRRVTRLALKSLRSSED